MSHLIRFKPVPVRQWHAARPVMIKNEALFVDFVQLANLYKMTFPNFYIEMKIGSEEEAIDTALTLFSMVEDKYFPLEHMWEWSDKCDYDEVRTWIYQIPIKVIGHDGELEPAHMIEPKALLARLSLVGNYSDAARRHKQVLKCQYAGWEWGDLLDVFRLSQVIETLDDMFLPPPFDKLPALVKYMTGETGTYFLDYGLEHWPHYIQWSKSNIDWLVSDWEAALQIMNQSDALCDWLTQNPEQLEKVWTILKIAHERKGL